MRAIIFVPALADVASETGPDLGTHPNPIAFLDILDRVANLDGSPYHLMANARGPLKSPSHQ